jgi:N utilization substance protein A
MSLAIGKKGQNVRLAAKLVQWRIDIKGEEEARELLDQSAFMTPKTAHVTEDFLGMVKDAKGLGEKVVALLFAGNVVNSSIAIERGVKGLVELPNIGPKKAEAILELAQACFDDAKAEAARQEEEEQAAKSQEDAGDESGYIEEADASEEMEETEAEEVITEAEEDNDEEEQDIPVEDLVDIDPEIIQLLISNEFQTLAELSITPLEELSSIEGISEETAGTVLEQARQRMAQLENTK